MADSTDTDELVIVCGNPQPASRTLACARNLATRLAAELGIAAISEIDIATLGPGLLGWGDPDVAAAKAQACAARALVVASPTYKASLTGLLKLFLDSFDRDALGGRLCIPLMTGGSPHHSLAVEVHLRPVLIEIGASCPTRGVYLSGDQIDRPDEALDAWLGASRRALGLDNA